MKKVTNAKKLNLVLVALLLLGGYLGLMHFLGTSSPLLLVQGTSMEPTYHEGDLLLSRHVSPTEIEVGDVIAFSVPSDYQQRLDVPPKAVHRVIGVEGVNGQLLFVTQGDNSDIDPFKVQASEVRGVVTKNLGPLGKPILFATSSRALVLGLAILTFGLIVLATLWMSPNEKPEVSAGRVPAQPRKNATASEDLNGAIGVLAASVAEYGVHLQTHTAVIKHMGASSLGLDRAVQRQNVILTDLEEVLRSLKGAVPDDDLPDQPEEMKKVKPHPQDGAELEKHASGNGHKTSNEDAQANTNVVLTDLEEVLRNLKGAVPDDDLPDQPEEMKKVKPHPQDGKLEKHASGNRHKTSTKGAQAKGEAA